MPYPLARILLPIARWVMTVAPHQYLEPGKGLLMGARWSRRIGRAGTWLGLAVFALWAWVVVRVAWSLASQPAGGTDAAVAQGELLVSALSLVLQPLLFVATAVTARATINTVREMRDTRTQERQFEKARRGDVEIQAIRDDAWLLIGNVYAIAGVAGAVGGVLSRAFLGRVRRSVEHPLMQTALSTPARVAEAICAAERLIDARGPWATHAEALRDIVLDLSGELSNVGRSQALIGRIPQAIDDLRDALPRHAAT